MRGRSAIAALLLYGLMLGGATPARSAVTTAQCLECHGVAGETPTAGRTDQTSIYLGDWERSVHGGFECTDCHADVTAPEHPTPLQKPDCSGCHAEQALAYSSGAHASRAAAGDSQAPTCSSCHDPHTVRSASDTTSVLHRSRVAQVCVRCHADEKNAGGRDLAVPHPAQAYTRGAHERAMRAGNLRAATCGDCHDSHAARRAQDPASPVYRTSIPATCGVCHSEIFAAYAASVHGVALQHGVTGTPVCNTCHGEHAVATFGGEGQGRLVASETCESCHRNPILARRYELPTGAVSSYEDSYHGRAARGGLAQAAGCTSCHGVHRILAASDSASTIYPANLQRTCAACHPGATPAFAASYAHDPSRLSANDRAAITVRGIYRWVIGLIIGGMLLHNLIVWRWDLRRAFQNHQVRAVHQRFTRGELRQHALLLSSFFALVITGFALRYPDALWARALAAMGLDEAVRRIVHRVAAVVMIAVSLYHLAYLFTRRGREQLAHMAPGVQDVYDFLANMAYHFGKRPHPPAFSRFRYIEKAEYWALVWGTIVMVGTGFILWFPTKLAGGPLWLVRVAEAVHLYEAWLAFLAIVVWHFFFVLFRPGIPGSFTAITGRMDPEELAHEHPGEYANLYGPQPAPGAADEPSERAG